MSPEDLAALKQAKHRLENPGFAAKASNLLGKPVEKAIEYLPSGVAAKMEELTQDALAAALRGALMTMDPGPAEESPWWHKGAAVIAGGAGGFFGLAGLAFELPVSTTILCRTIADIARANGESPNDPETKIACLQVFALGGSSSSDDGTETGYFAVRAGLAKAVTDATAFLAKQTLAAEGAPPLVRLIALVAARFQIQVTEKAAAQAVPVIGAAAGALINLAFADHFQEMSRGHFTVRRLERRYGSEVVERVYRTL